MDNKQDMDFIRESGNHLIKEMTLLQLKIKEALVFSRRDINTDKSASEAIGGRKYELLFEIRDLIAQVKPDYLGFMEFLHFPAGRSEWELPFDEEFKDVDINMDCQAIDRFFDINLKKVYMDVRTCRQSAIMAFHAAMDGRMYYRCPCCESTYFLKNGDYDICPVCNWENDKTQNTNQNYRGGANKDSLNEASVKFHTLLAD